MVEDGEAELAEDGKRRKLALPAGVFMAPGCRVHLEAPPASTWYRLTFDAVYGPRRRAARGRAFVPARRGTQPGPRAVWGVDLPALVPRELLASCRRMLRQCCALWWQSDLDWLRANHYLGLWLTGYVSWAEARGGLGAEDWLARIEKVARERLDSGVSVAELADSARLSTRQFVRLYRAARGCLPREFLLRLRMERARSLLQGSSDPVQRIAKLCGYHSPATFCHQFTRLSGTNPTAWRRQSP
jgi:AraC-like DNA-binding protein